jgi:membrane-associated phospholipid phosphatase
MLLCGKVEAQNTDIRWLRSVHSNTANPTVMEGISLSSYGLAFALPAGQLIYGFAVSDTVSVRNGIQTIAGLALTTGITYGLKYSIQRERPYDTYPDIVPHKMEDSYSMPSGHTSLAFSLATSAGLQYRKWYVIAPAYVYACAVGYSRIYLGVHYPSDILVGAAFGAGSAWLAYKGQQWLLKSKKKRKGF